LTQARRLAVAVLPSAYTPWNTWYDIGANGCAGCSIDAASSTAGSLTVVAFAVTSVPSIRMAIGAPPPLRRQ